MKILLVKLFSAIFISASISTLTMAQTLDVEAPQVVARGINPRGLAENNGQFYFSAQRDADVASWNKILLWSSKGSTSSTSPVELLSNKLLYPKIYLGLYDDYLKEYSKFIVNGSEMLSIGDSVYISTLEGIAKTNVQSGQTGVTKFKRTYNPVNNNVAENRSGMITVKGKIYLIAFGEIWEVTPETMSIKQLTTFTEKKYSHTDSHGITSSYYYMASDIGVAGESLIVVVSTVGSLQFGPTISSSVVALTQAANATMTTTPLVESANVSTLQTTGITPIVDVFVKDRLFSKPIGRYLGKGTALITKEVVPSLLASELRTYTNFPSDTGNLYSMTRGKSNSTLWCGTTTGETTLWKSLWHGTENITRGYIRNIKAADSNVYLRYSTGETIVVRADGTWRTVLSTDSDATYVNIIFDSSERLRVGDYLYFSSANGQDLLTAKINTHMKAASYKPSTVAVAQPSASPTPVVKGK